MSPLQRLRARIDWVPGEHQPRPVRAGVAAFGVLALLLLIAYGGWRPWQSEGELVRAEFETADQVVEGRTAVRVAGVPVGVVRSVERAADGRGAAVTMELTEPGLEVRRDASAEIRLRTILSGTRYIDLEPGSPSAPPLGDGLIPVERTTSTLDWDDVIAPYDGPNRLAQRAILRGLRDGLGDPERAGRVIEELGPAVSAWGRASRAFRGQEAGDLPRFVDSAGRVMDALSHHEGSLEQLVASGSRTLGVTAARREALGQAVELSPPALTETRVTMERLETTLGHLDPLVADLLPGARELAPALIAARPALDATERLLERARPLTRKLPPALRGLAAMSRPGASFLDRLPPTLARTDEDILPWLEEVDTDTGLKNYQSLGPAVAALDAAFASYDENGWFLQWPVPPAANSFLLPCSPGLNPGELERCGALSDVLGQIVGGEPVGGEGE